MGPPNVLGFPKPASSMSTSSTFGDPSGASGCPMRFQSGFDPSSVRLLIPWNGGLRIGRVLPSGSPIVCPPVRFISARVDQGAVPDGQLPYDPVLCSPRAALITDHASQH